MRQTNDADLVILIESSDVSKILNAFPDPYLIYEAELVAALASDNEFRPVQLLHLGEAFKIDLFLLKGDEYEISELGRSRKVEVMPGSFINFYCPENVVLAKLRWYVAGNQISDRQWNDIVQVLDVQAGAIDNSYMDIWAKYFNVHELLDIARSQLCG